MSWQFAAFLTTLGGLFATYKAYLQPFLQRKRDLIKSIDTLGFSPREDGKNFIEWDILVELEKQSVSRFVVFCDWEELQLLRQTTSDSKQYELTVVIPDTLLPNNEVQVDVKRWWKFYKLTAKRIYPHWVLKKSITRSAFQK